MTANFSMTGAIGDLSHSLNVTAGTQRSRFVSRTGDQAVETRQETQNLTATGGLGGEALGWSMQLGLEGSLLDARQDGLADFRSRNLSAAANGGADRSLMELPAGPLRTSLSGRFSYAEGISEAGAIRTRLSTGNVDLNGNVVIPLSRRRSPQDDGVGKTWGDMSVTLGGGMKGLAGTSTQGQDVTIGLNWSPTQKLRLNTQWSSSTDGPADPQRLAPIAYGLPVVVFDFLSGGAVEILPIVGGNPDLQPQSLRSFAVSASVGPYTPWRIAGALSWRSARSTNGISSLPTFSPDIEAAFPDRFVRDAEGRLTSIDQRPVNLDSTLADSLSSNLNFRIPFSTTPLSDSDYLQLAINHTWQLRNLFTLHQGLPVMDRLDGDGGGLSRHQVSVQADGRYRKWGVNAGVNWRGGSRIRRDTGRDGPADLRLREFVTTDLRLSYVFQPSIPDDPAVPRSRRYDGLRLEMAVENLFDARPEATLGGGGSAPGYGRDDQDPLGRVVRVILSKRF